MQPNLKNMLLLHREYYRDRLTEYELCQDFPGDEILIDGLYSMQSHFDRNGVNIAIPIVRVMNTAHWLAAYMFSTECSGDQMEYEAMASMSVGRDKQLAIVAMIVLAAMLKRTEGFRAKQCRNVILDNRPPDFEEGVSLYDRFLRSAEKHFAEEDFLIDTHAQIVQLQEENTRLTSENIKLKYTITTMEEKYQQINIGTQNNNYGTINNFYGYSPSSSTVPQNAAVKDSPSVSSEINSDIPLFKYIHVAVIDDKEREQIHKMVCNIVRLPQMKQVCEELYKLMKDRKVLCTINPDSMLAELRRMGLPNGDINGFSDKNFAHYYRAPKID